MGKHARRRALASRMKLSFGLLLLAASAHGFSQLPEIAARSALGVGAVKGRFQQFLCELTGAELFCPPPEEGKGFCNGELHKAEVLDLGLKEDGSNYWCHEYESVPGSTCENSFVHYDLQTVYNFVHFYQPCGRTKDGRCAVAEVFAEATDERFVVGAVCKEECLTSGDAPCKDEEMLCCNEKPRETGETDCNPCEIVLR